MTTNFWDDGKEVIRQAEEIEISSGGGGLLPIPERTQVRINIAEAKWETTDKEGTFISLKHQVVAPACYKNRVIFQKLHVNPESGTVNANLSDEDRQKKRSKALKMLAVIDTNAGGKLTATTAKPDDLKLQSSLVGKGMMMLLGEYCFKDKDGAPIENPVDYIRGNWVMKVAPKDRFVEMTKEEQDAAVAKSKAEYEALLAAGPSQQAPRQQAPRQQQKPAGGGQPQTMPDFDSFDDDIPF